MRIPLRPLFIRCSVRGVSFEGNGDQDTSSGAGEPMAEQPTDQPSDGQVIDEPMPELVTPSPSTVLGGRSAQSEPSLDDDEVSEDSVELTRGSRSMDAAAFEMYTKVPQRLVARFLNMSVIVTSNV